MIQVVRICSDCVMIYSLSKVTKKSPQLSSHDDYVDRFAWLSVCLFVRSFIHSNLHQ